MRLNPAISYSFSFQANGRNNSANLDNVMSVMSMMTLITAVLLGREGKSMIDVIFMIYDDMTIISCRNLKALTL
jgi:hypothetical protein